MKWDDIVCNVLLASNALMIAALIYVLLARGCK